MSSIIIVILFIISGFFMKLSDDFYDENRDILFSCIFAVIYALASLIATVNDVGAAYIFISIIIGNLLALKVDAADHILALVIFVSGCLMFGVPHMDYIVLLICVIAALTDEIGHEFISKITDNTFMHLFFEYRFVMKIVVFILAFTQAFGAATFIGFILFEIAYECAGVIFKSSNLKKEEELF